MVKSALSVIFAFGFIGGVGHWLLSSNAKIEDDARALLASPEFKDSMSQVVAQQSASSSQATSSPQHLSEMSPIARAAASLGDPDQRDQLLKTYFRDPSGVLNELVVISADPEHQREVLETVQFIETTGVTPETQGAVLTILDQIITRSTQPGLKEYAVSLRDSRLEEMAGDDREPAAIVEPEGESASAIQQ